MPLRVLRWPSPGEPQVIVAAFIRLSPARHAARRLLAAGPVAGGRWAAALITGRAWTWPVPATVRLLFGAVLITVIGLLTAAAVGQRYLPAELFAAPAARYPDGMRTGWLLLETPR